MQHPYAVGILVLMFAFAALAQEHSNVGVLTCTAGGTEAQRRP